MTAQDVERGNHLICPECDEPLFPDQEWVITDRSLIGTEAGSTEEMQGDYAHEKCWGGSSE